MSELRMTRYPYGTALAMIVVGAVVLCACDAHAEMELIDSTVVTSVTGVWTDDDEHQVSRRHGLGDDDVVGGLEALRMEWYGDEGESMLLEGRAIVDNSDYLLTLDFKQPEKGFVSAGYKEFRTYYDGSGGFFPQTGAFPSIFGEGLELDRGRAWFEGGMRVPGLPELTLRYDHMFRDGEKSSTIWGDSSDTGGLGNRGITPAFRDVDETRHIVALKISQDLPELSDTEVGAAFTYESAELDNSLNFARRPGDVGAERFVTQRDSIDSDVYSVHAYSTTPMADGRARVSASYAYTNLQNELGGSRVYGEMFGSAYDPALANRQPFDEGFFDLSGDSELRRHVGALTWLVQPNDDFRLTLRVRGEATEIESDSAFTESNVGFPPGLASSTEDLSVDTDSKIRRMAERFELRHTGFENLVLYFRANWEQADIDLDETEVETATAAVDLLRETDSDLRAAKYTLGGMWYPHSRLNFAGRYRYENRQNDYTHRVDSTSDNTSNNRLPAYITAEDITTRGGDLRATWTAHDTLRLTARFDIAQTEIGNASQALREVRAAEIQTHSISGSATWSPTASMYVQADVRYVDSKTDTPTNSVGGGVGDTVPDFENDYWNATVNVGIALDEKTDLENRYFFYRADNYTDNSLVSQPYGADAEEHGVSLSLRRQWTDALATRLRYAYFKNDDDRSGGNNDYELSALTGSLEVKF